METNQELLKRYSTVLDLYNKAKAKAEKRRAQPGRDRAFRWTGSLAFTLVSMETEILKRGLKLEKQSNA